MTTLEYALTALGIVESDIPNQEVELSLAEEKEHLKKIISCIRFVEHAKKSHSLPDICCPDV